VDGDAVDGVGASQAIKIVYNHEPEAVLSDFDRDLGK
jgi:hypothetical protein